MASLALALMLIATPHPAHAQPAPDTTAPASSPRAKLLHKLQSITVSVNFDKADIATVLDFLSKKSKELDPEKQGINFVLQLPDDAAKTSDASAPHSTVHREVTITLNDVPIAAILDYITQMTNLQYFVDDYAVSLRPLAVQTPPSH